MPWMNIRLAIEHGLVVHDLWQSRVSQRKSSLRNVRNGTWSVVRFKILRMYSQSLILVCPNGILLNRSSRDVAPIRVEKPLTSNITESYDQFGKNLLSSQHPVSDFYILFLASAGERSHHPPALVVCLYLGLRPWLKCRFSLATVQVSGVGS